jgi:tetratricopeptide (TPR) repeat protein
MRIRNLKFGVVCCFGLALFAAVPLPNVPERSAEAATADDLASAAVAKSIALEKEQKYDEAITGLNAVRKSSYLVYMRLGWLHYLKADYTASRSFYQMAMRMAPKAVEPRLGLTLPLLAEYRYAEAEATAKAILSLDANNYTASLRLTTALRLQGKYRPAREINAAMLELYPTDITFLAEQLLTSAASKQNDVAALRDMILALDPENATAKYYQSPASSARKN